jgi:hypothetical protein
MRPFILESDKFIIKVYPNDFVEYIIKKDVLLDEKAARESKKLLEEFKPGAKFFILAEGMDFFRVTRGVRRLAVSKSFSNHMAAVAFCSTNFSLQLLGELYIKINKPPIPTKLFMNKKDAEEWLKELLIKQASTSQV